MPNIEVEIPGKGIAEFPEGMNPMDIEHAIYSSFPDVADNPIKQKKAALLAERDKLMRGPSMREMQEGIGEALEEQQTKPFAKIPRPSVSLEETGVLPKAASQFIDAAFEKSLNAVESLETPLGVEMLVTGGAIPKAAGAVAGLFGAGQIVTESKGLVEGIKEKDPKKIGSSAIGVAIGAGMGALAGKSVARDLAAEVGVSPESAEMAAVSKAPPLEVPVSHETALPGASDTFKEIVGEQPKPTEGEPNASSQQSAATLGGDVLRVGESARGENEARLPVNEVGEGVRVNEVKEPTGAQTQEVATTLDDLPENTQPIPELRGFEYHPGDFQKGLPVYSHPDAKSELARRFGIPTEVGSGIPGEGNYLLFVNERAGGRPIALWKKFEKKTTSEPVTPTVESVGVPPDTIRSSPVTEPSPPESRPLGIASPSSINFLNQLVEPYQNAIKAIKGELSWKTFAQETLPEWTRSNREVGETGAEYAAAPMVGEAMGRKFARDVMEDRAKDPVFDRQLGTALKEDNLRDIRKVYQDKADEARAAGDDGNADLYDEAAKSVVTLVGGKNSPFRSEADYRAFMDDPRTQSTIARYKQLFAEQKEPLFREAAGVDPETELAGRGLETGARINLTFKREGQELSGGTVAGRSLGGNVRQLGTLLRKDPFLRQATGTGSNYHASLSDTMADAFAREYPVAKQHEFIRKALESGVVQVGKDFKAPEGFKSYVLKLNPWRGQNLYVPERLVPEYEALVGLRPGMRIPVLTPAATVLTRQSIAGLGEGSAHSANILLKLFTGITSAHPWREAFLSALPGRPDAITAVAKAIFKGLRPNSDTMLELAKINAAKRPYGGPIASHILNPLDKGVRVLSSDVFHELAKAGIVKDTKTNLREFVNEVGNYTQSVQSSLVRNLRSSQIQPFATGFRTAKVQVIKRLALSPGLEATDTMNAVALRAAILGKFIGTATTVATLNYLVSGHARGYQGTPIGSVSWKDDKGKVHYFDLGGFTGATSGAKALGIMQAIEAKERNLDTSTAGKQAARALGNTVISQFAGPGVRFGTIALSGKDPYGNQIADVSPPTNDALNSQAAKDIQAALQSVNPVVDLVAGIHEGRTWEEVRQRQLTRYATRTPSSLATSDKFTEIVTKKNLIEYADWLASRARKLDRSERGEFIRKRLAEDKVTGPSYKEVQMELKKKGVFRFE